MTTAVERDIYDSYLAYALNQALLPLKLAVPQPLVARVPLLTTNYEIRVRIVLKLIAGRLLDIGCGTNELVLRYRREGGEGVGADVYGWPNVDLVVADSSRLPYPDASFDTISFVACLNHIPNRHDVLLEARRLLKPGGRVVLTNLSPGISRIWHRWAFWDADQHERGMAEGEVWGFGHEEVVRLLDVAGFSLASVHPFSWHLNRAYVFVAPA